QFSEGKADFTIMVTGWYRITFSGSMLSVDGLSVKSGTLQFLEKGSHFAETEQFIEDLEIILVKRK
ncbi:MAG: hypothetical protein N2115_02270, partial [bacterium]|nr:hypothetical protein [bacterium]